MRFATSRAGAVLWSLLACGAAVSTVLAADASLPTATAVELKSDDFAYGLNVLTPSDAAAYRASLPLDVYRKVVRGDLGDVRVFNERDEAVPSRVERPSSQSVVQATPTSLPIFTLRKDSRESRAALDAIRVTIQSGTTRVDVQAPVSARASAAKPSNSPSNSSGNSIATTAGGASTPAGGLAVDSYVLDGRALQSPVSAFQLSWPDSAADFAGRLRVEASDDLGVWYTVVTGAPIANLRAGDARILERRVELAGTSAKFWRLTWADAPAPFEITSVIAEPARDRVDVVRFTLPADAKAVPDKPGEFEFDLGAQAPVDRVNLELPEQNSIVEVQLLSRATPTQPWRFVTRGGFYRLKNVPPVAAATAGANGAPPPGPDGAAGAAAPTGAANAAPAVEVRADLTNGALAIEPNADRYWLARIDMRGGGLGRSAPKLTVGWLPHDVVFLARGAGPFTLAYGSAKASATTALGGIPDSAAIVNAHFADPRTLGGDARLSASVAPVKLWTKSGTLWAVLAVGVALLAFMAYRLSRDFK